VGSYEVRLVVTDAEAQNESSKTFEIIGPPHSGHLVVSPSTGTALESLFSLQAFGWIDEAANLPLRYDFF